jgi:hypothetical protein
LTDDAGNDVGRLSRLKSIAELENGEQRTSTPSCDSLGGSSWSRKSIVESVVRRTPPMDFPLRVIVALVVIGAFAGVGLWGVVAVLQAKRLARVLGLGPDLFPFTPRGA